MPGLRPRPTGAPPALPVWRRPYRDLRRRGRRGSGELRARLVDRGLGGGLWDTGFQFGDWLDPDAPPDSPAAAKADTGVVATACPVRSARFAAEAARLIGEVADADRWEALAVRTLAAARLAEVVGEAGYKVSTGFAGTPFVTWALSETGHVEAAYRLLLEEGCPSWLYPVSMGATTIWERWDSMLPDGSINPGEMTSFNHYALGAVADWIYQVVLGIRPGWNSPAERPSRSPARARPCASPDPSVFVPRHPAPTPGPARAAPREALFRG